MKNNHHGQKRWEEWLISGKMYESIRQGLQEAIEHAQGKKLLKSHVIDDQDLDEDVPVEEDAE